KVIILDDLSTGKLENIRLLIEFSWHSDPLLFVIARPFPGCRCESFTEGRGNSSMPSHQGQRQSARCSLI
ncbi:MAG: hypothetical protein KAU10_03835, partial [Dehalococcoidia bacterium]|nr:hypothetical protein [Dehalococcoidia bacterium]